MWFGETLISHKLEPKDVNTFFNDARENLYTKVMEAEKQLDEFMLKILEELKIKAKFRSSGDRKRYYTEIYTVNTPDSGIEDLFEEIDNERYQHTLPTKRLHELFNSVKDKYIRDFVEKIMPESKERNIFKKKEGGDIWTVVATDSEMTPSTGIFFAHFKEKAKIVGVSCFEEEEAEDFISFYRKNKKDAKYKLDAIPSFILSEELKYRLSGRFRF